MEIVFASGEELARSERELIEVIAASGEVLVTWRAFKDGEPCLLSPWFERLEAFHRLAWGEGLGDEGMAELISAQVPRVEAGAPSTRPAPALANPLVPPAISASGYNSLLACPYQYYARHALRLNE